MTTAPAPTRRTAFERRVATAAFAAAPALVVMGVVAVLTSPHVMAEDELATGRDLWLGAAFGGLLFVLVTAVPQVLFGLGLRRTTRAPLVATAVLAGVWAVYIGLMPLAQVIVEGWDGVAPAALIASAAMGVLDALVCAAAVIALRRVDADTDAAADGVPQA